MTGLGQDRFRPRNPAREYRILPSRHASRDRSLRFAGHVGDGFARDFSLFRGAVAADAAAAAAANRFPTVTPATVPPRLYVTHARCPDCTTTSVRMRDSADETPNALPPRRGVCATTTTVFAPRRPSARHTCCRRGASRTRVHRDRSISTVYRSSRRQASSVRSDRSEG